MAQMKHTFQRREFPIDGRILGALLLPVVYISIKEIARDSARFHQAEEGLKMQPPSGFRIVERSFSVDAVIAQEVLCKFCNPNSFDIGSNKRPCRYLREPSPKDSRGLSLVGSAGGFPIHLAVPVVLDPPNRASLLLVDSSRPTRATHLALRRA